jgi:iron complex transport system permease protein
MLVCHRRELDAFAIGESAARNLGVNVRRTKVLLLVAVALGVGVSVAVAGTIGFVGLVIPHICRLLTGPGHKRLLPASCAVGAAFLMLCDLLARTVLQPQELPIGVITSLVGAVVFVYLFARRRQRGRG